MSVRIDLLKASERRYQGPVSGKFIGFITVLVILATIILVASYLAFTGLMQRRQLSWSKDAWSSLEPRYKRMLEIKEKTEHISSLQDDLKSWHENRLDWHILLDKIRDRVPPNVQVKSLSIQDSLKTEGDKVEAGERLDASRQFKMGLKGVSHGENGEAAVIELISELRNLKHEDNIFQTVSLNSMQREKTDGDTRSFTISGTGRERDLP